MLYRIIQDIPGRLRLRCGSGIIGNEEACGIAYELRAIEGVSAANVSSANGSMLIIFRDDVRENILEAVDEMDALALPKATEDSTISIQREDAEFKRTVIAMVAWRAFRRLFVPYPLRMAFTVMGSIQFIAKGLAALFRGRLAVEVLDAAAIIASLAQRQFASASSIMFLLQISEVMQHHVNARTRIALEEGLLARAETAWTVDEDGRDVEVSLESVRIGQLIRVRTGQSIPVDGTVIVGEGEVNEASMTGESALAHKALGSSVFAGTVIEDGSMVLRTEALPGASRIDRIVSLVEESSQLKAQAQSNAERLADGLVPFSFMAFLGALLLSRNVTKAVSVLMVDYSCAIKISTPIAVMSAMREAMDRGAIVKGGKYLEQLAMADVVVFDKTGTLTEAKPEVEKVICFGNLDEGEMLRTAACLEEHFPHSIARAIVQAAKDRGLHHGDENHAEVDYLVAHGIASSINGRKIRLGSAHFIFDDEGIGRPDDLADRLALEASTASTVFMSVDDHLEGVLCISDPIRADAANTLKELRALGIGRIVMLTGDSPPCAVSVADKLGIDEVHAQMLPEDKSRYVSQLKEAGHAVIMVGDGINDSPALASASVSVALNDASDIARAVADVSVLNDDLRSLVMLKRLSSGLMQRIRFDYRFIVVLNTVLIALGVAGIVAPTVGAYLHNASTVAIAAGNTRPLLNRGDFPQHPKG